MEHTLKQRLLKLTEPLLATHDWSSLENLWRPYVDQGDLDAQALLAYMCLWCFDETEQKDEEMRGLLRAAANAGHADAMYWLASFSMSEGAVRDELLKRAAELGSRGGPTPSWRNVRNGRLDSGTEGFNNSGLLVSLGGGARSS